MTLAALGGLGGMGRFVSRGSKVVIKPNVGWDRPFRFRANTHPDIVRAVARAALDAGAADVRIVDFPVEGQNPRAAFAESGMDKVGQDIGVRVYPVFEEDGFAGVSLPDGVVLKKERVIREILDADVVINVPIAKTHVCTKYTGALKNWMGIVWNRKFFHHDFKTDFRSSPEHWRHIAQCIADIQRCLPPTLNVLDATVVMKTNGPNGPGELEEKGEILASTDPVAIDVYGVGLIPTVRLEEVWSIDRAAELGLGERDLSKVEIEDVS